MNKIKQLILLALCLFSSTGAWAAGTKIGKIYYILRTYNNTASVTYTGDLWEESSYYGDITIPSEVEYNGVTYTVTEVGSYAFYDAPRIKNVTIPSSVTKIDNWAFYGCTGLTSIDIPNSVTSIGSSVFSDCTGLTSIDIPNSVTSIGTSVFNGCLALKKISVANDNTVYDSRENCNAIIETATNTLIVGCQSTIIPSSVTKIDEWALSGCTGLTSIDIPNTVTTIGEYAFYDCKGLTSVTIPGSVTKIGEYNQEIKGKTNVEIIPVSA